MNADPLKVQQVVEEEMQMIVDQIQNNIITTGKQATGKFGQSIELIVQHNGDNFNVRFFAAEFFKTLETGRRPTPDKKPSREMIENLGEWADARGLDEGAVWAIATKINNEGTQLWKDGGRKDIYSKYFQPTYMKQVTARIAKVAGKEYANNLLRFVKSKKK